MRQTLLAAAAVAGLGISSAHAEFILNFAQVGNNVVASGSGTLDLSGLTFAGVGSAISGITPSSGVVGVGPSTADADYYSGFTGPTSVGAGGSTFPSTTTGDFIGIEGVLNYLVVPSGFVSGGSLSGTDTFDNATFASLGLTPGEYVFVWDVPDDSFTVNIPDITPAPEPASVVLFATGLLGLGLTRRRKPRAHRTSRSPA